MANIQISSAILTAIKFHKDAIVAPGEGYQGSVLPNQEMVALFKAQPVQEVTLVSFTCTQAPQEKIEMVGANKTVPRNTGKFQLRGIAEIRVGSLQGRVNMHVHTAAAFENDKSVCVGTIGEITQGNNSGQFWLALRSQTEVTTDQMLAFVDKHATADTKAATKAPVLTP